MRAILLTAGFLFCAAPAFAGKVAMYTDESYSKKIKREKLDCTIHKNKKRALTFGFKLSVAFAAKAGPEVTFGRSTEINWNRMSQELIRRYEELCDMHNKSHLTVVEFDRRYKELDKYYDKAKDLKEEIEDTVAARSAKQFADLDREARKHSQPDEDESLTPRAKVDRISKDVESLSGEIADLSKQTKPRDN
jgi:hypothetical protein